MSSNILDEIKIEIRSLLISSQKGLSEDELCRDYSLFNCQRSLPYQLFGYSTKIEFLHSLTDILYQSSDGLFHPIVDQSTEHIFKFVQQQRTNKKKKQKKPSIVSHQQAKNNRNIRKSTLPIISSFQQMYLVPAGTHNIKTQGSFSRMKPPIKEFLPTFERVHVTNELLQCLLMHFRQQQKQ